MFPLLSLLLVVGSVLSLNAPRCNPKIRCTCPPRLPNLWQLNETYDPNDTKNIVRLKDCFQFKNHLCLVFELLSINLYELLKQNQFRGLPLPLIRHFIKQILEVTGCN